MLTIHRQINLQVRIRLIQHRLLYLLLSYNILWIEFFHDLPLICVLIRVCLQHFHIRRKFRAMLANVWYLLFRGGRVRHYCRTIESVA